MRLHKLNLTPITPPTERQIHIPRLDTRLNGSVNNVVVLPVALRRVALRAGRDPRLAALRGRPLGEHSPGPGTGRLALRT